MKIQDFIRLKSKERIFNILIQFTDQYTENKEGYFKQVGIISKGILKHFYKVIQPTTYFVHLLGETLNKIQYRKILELYKLDPKDFVDQDPDSLYAESQKKGLYKASKQIAQERIDKLKLEKHSKQDILSEKHKKMV